MTRKVLWFAALLGAIVTVVGLSNRGVQPVTLSGSDGAGREAPPPAPQPAAETPRRSWKPPIGIPAPAFGIDEAAPPAPSPWTASAPGFY